MEVVSLRLRRVGRARDFTLPALVRARDERATRDVELTVGSGDLARCAAVTRASLLDGGDRLGPLLIVDPEATTYVPPRWLARTDWRGSVLLERNARE
jgi:hypothetical protein